MTVKELRDALAALPDDLPILHEYDNSWTDDVKLYRVSLVWDETYQQYSYQPSDGEPREGVVIGGEGPAIWSISHKVIL